jgi:hypothetical protein
MVTRRCITRSLIKPLSSSPSSSSNTVRPYILKARAKVETYQDEARVKCTVVSPITPLDFKEGSKEVLKLIREGGYRLY